MSPTYDSNIIVTTKKKEGRKTNTEGGNFRHPGAPRNVSVKKDVAAGRLRDQLKTLEKRVLFCRGSENFHDKSPTQFSRITIHW